MAQTAASTAGDIADLVSNAVVNPKASLLLRHILKAAVQNSGEEADWKPEAHALLANVMMNDCLNWWNLDFPVDLECVQYYVTRALSADPPRPTQAHAQHAQALIYRANRKHALALTCFQKAADLDSGFARAHAQIGNQYVRTGQEAKSHDCFKKARSIAKNHPAIGYFDWGEGRAYFQKKRWPRAIRFLRKSVEELPTVWYNRCFLAAAQDAAGHTDDAIGTITDFVEDPQFETAFPKITELYETTFSKIKELSPRESSNDSVFAAWQRALIFAKRHLP